MSIGETIREIRKIKGIKAVEMADKIGVSKSAVSQWEKGEGPATLSTLRKIADVLDVNFLTLFEPLPDHVKTKDDLERYDNENDPYYRAMLSELDLSVSDENSADFELLFNNYVKLNPKGKDEAVKRVEELTHIPKYTE